MLESIREETNRLIADLNKTTDRNIQVMEDRVGQLKEQLKLADRRITLLKRDRERLESQAGRYSSLRAVQGAGLAGPGEKTVLPENKWNSRNADNKKSQDHRQSEEEADPQTADQAGKEEEKESAELGEQVREMHKQGFSAEVIARRLKASVSEVELIISLVKNRW